MMGTRRVVGVVSLGLFVAGPASADEFETYFAGHVGTGLQYDGAVGAFGTVLSQAEFDFRGGTGDWFFRVDLDYHFDAYYFESGLNDGYNLAPHYPLPPEWAVVQWKPSSIYLRAGVTNPDMGIQEWDERDNYLPTYTSGWGMQNAQNLGGEVGWEFGDGTDLFAWGGWDMAWQVGAFGLGVQTELDFFGTWTGAFYMPALQYFGVWTANEIYPATALWLTLELNGGLVGSTPFFGGQVMANLFPDAVIGGAVRGEAQLVYPDEVEALLGDLPEYGVSGALRADLIPLTRLMLEAKESWPGDGGSPYFTGTLYVSVMWGDPEPYENFDVVDEE